MGRYFGTDGVRGVANLELDALLAFKIGAAAAYALTQEATHTGKAKLLIGKDTRISSDMLAVSYTHLDVYKRQRIDSNTAAIKNREESSRKRR